jgi:hypothetical protein
LVGAVVPLATVITAAGGKIDAGAAQQIECRPLLGNAGGVMQWQDGNGRSEGADAFGPRRDIGKH